MKRKKLLVFLFLVLANTFCFSKPQQPITDTLILIEKVYLHTDRSTYFVGEDIWFKAYLIDGLDHSLTNHSNNLHIELITPDLKIIARRIIRLENGLGNGDFKIAPVLTSGKYKIRAYTNYMRNFGDQLFFTKEINVINANEEHAESSDEVKYLENKFSLNFFPEGGSLVDNVSSVVAFKFVDYSGLGSEVFGKVYSSNNDLITTFRSSHHGMGSFLLRPFPGLKYYSVFRGADSINRRAELPVSFPQGAALSVSKNQNDEI